MEYVKLGNSDLRVSRICLGCMGFGDPNIGQHSWTIGEEPTREIIRRSLDLGVNFFDTAIAYQLGTSEQYVGRALRDMAKRDDVVVATKFLPRTDEEIQQGIIPATNGRGNPAGHRWPSACAEQHRPEPAASGYGIC